MPLVWAGYLPNVPFLIDPPSFGGAGREAVRAISELRFLERFRPEVIVISTPHWVGPRSFLVQSSPRPPQIYDFSGFPPALSKVKYGPPGDPALAKVLVDAGRSAGLEVETTTTWGLDHGAWAPLLHLAPGGRVPVVPLSIRPYDPQRHMRWGEAMRAPLFSDLRRAAFVATGSIVHDVDRFDPDLSARWAEGEALEQQILDRVMKLDTPAIADFDRNGWEMLKPEGGLGPLFTLLGVIGASFRPRVVSRSHAFGGFSLTTLEFLPHPESGG